MSRLIMTRILPTTIFAAALAAIGFAIPANLVARVVAAARAGGRPQG